MAAASANAQSSELTRLRALLIVDTRSGLGDSVVLDGRRMQFLLRSGIPPKRLDLTVYDKAKQLTRESILRYYRDLKTGPSETSLCYYAGHGAIDPEKGHFLALQQLDTEPLTRDELRKAMLQNKPGLVVILTDCCSDRHELKKKNRDVWDNEHKAINPVLHDLLFRHRGIVDITASTGNSAFGDEHQGGIFTRTFAKLIHTAPEQFDSNKDGFVNWKEFFPRLEKDTEATFVSWAQQNRALGEAIQQKSQRPRALQLASEAIVTSPVAGVTIRNDLLRIVKYEYRWNSIDPWKSASLAPGKTVSYPPPVGVGLGAMRLEVRSKEGNGTAKAGDTLRFHD